MNDNEKVLAALGEPKGNTENAGGEDLKAQLEKAQHASEVWGGRAKKLAEEKAALEEELRKVRASTEARDAVDKLTPEQLGDTPREFAEAAVTAAAGIMNGAQAKQNEELAKLRAEIAEKDRKAFLSQISAMNPRFFESVTPGGDKAAMWDKFRASNRETYAAIMASNDVGRFNNFVASFYREIGVPNPSGDYGYAAPDPRSTAGSNGDVAPNATEGKTYTTQEYLDALDAAETSFRANGDRKAYDEATALLNKALKEGRVR
jgi:hypothetical protein